MSPPRLRVDGGERVPSSSLTKELGISGGSLNALIDTGAGIRLESTAFPARPRTATTGQKGAPSVDPAAGAAPLSGWFYWVRLPASRGDQLVEICPTVALKQADDERDFRLALRCGRRHLRRG
jgi:hypothetical protein